MTKHRKRHPTNPPPRTGDTPAMREAIERLLAEKILFHRPTKFQLKADDLSLWPNTGTIFRDEDDAILPERGIEDLIRLLRPKRRSATDDGGAPPHLNLLIDQ